jgi:arabinofuranosyltransferase
VTWSRSKTVTFLSSVAVVLLFAFLAWHRRWISDDGLIFVRVVRNILGGHGPVFNAFERTEANTSALWPWLLALVGGITRANLSHVAVATGLVCSVAGLAVAMQGSRRWLRAPNLVPAGALIPLAVFPFWDYATSGLETSLTMLWLGAIWWLLVQQTPETSRQKQLWSAVAFGLGPLVRPDLAVASGTFLVAQCLLVAAHRKRVLAITGAAAALPVAYEVFRAGFYGTLVPLPAIAKGANHAAWGRGWDYLTCYIGPFALWVPVVALLVPFVIVTRKLQRRDRILIAAPVIAAIVMAIYVLRVGGDFMYARMWLPVTFLAVLPGMMLPLRKLTIASLAVIALWTAWSIHRDYTRTNHHINLLVEDERVGYVQWTHKRNPIDERAYESAIPILEPTIDAAIARRQRMLYTEGGVPMPLDPAFPSSPVFVAGRLGLGGALVPLWGVAVDTLGLANPIGARVPLNHPDEPPGHQKVLPWPWILADYADPARIEETEFSPAQTAAARRAMQCGQLRELLDSVRAPMTASRFLANLVGSIARTRLTIPSDPVDAEVRFCGHTEQVHVTASSSCEDWGWGKQNVIDGRRSTVIGKPLGYSSTVQAPTDHAEWVEIEYPSPQTIAKVRIYPRDDEGFVGVGFPIDFSIETWDGHAWVEQHRETGYPVPSGPQDFAFPAPMTTSKIRIDATHLQNGKVDGYALQLAEIELVH